MQLGTYCPINSGYLCTSVLAHGVTAVWRLVHLDYSKFDGDILSDLLLESQMFQPELQGYFLVQLTHGTVVINCFAVYRILTVA